MSGAIRAALADDQALVRSGFAALLDAEDDISVVGEADGAAGRPAALTMTGLAIAGFVYGLTITTRGGDLPDITYHATVLPLLIVTFVLILRTRRG